MRQTVNFSTARSSAHGQGKVYFTLIELLVVIAIIAILAAILMPSLASSRERAKQTQCSGNLKTLAFSTISYADDYNGNIPHHTAFKNGEVVPVHDKMFGQYGLGPVWKDYAKATIVPYFHGQVHPDKATAKLADLPKQAVCPAGRRHPGSDNPVMDGFPHGSYSYNQYLVTAALNNAGDPDPRYDTFARIQSPSTRFLIADVGANTNCGKEVSGKNSTLSAAWHHRFFQYRHNDRTNIAFADGHVTSMTLEEAAAQTRDGNGGSDISKANTKRFWHDYRGN